MSLYRENGYESDVNVPPSGYWDDWRRECDLADRIVVNSEWSFQGLCAEGIPAAKLRVIPLAYDRPLEADVFVRSYPSAFDSSRPLRVLFLGQVNLRKGISEILAAIPRCEKLPVEFWMVGPPEFPPPPAFRNHPQIKWFGGVPRSAAAGYYRDADVFLFPTFSDGFGLTQLEAQAWKLPVVASKRCGDVVRHMENGYLLPSVTADAIVDALQILISSPSLLSQMAARADLGPFSLESLSARLTDLAENL